MNWDLIQAIIGFLLIVVLSITREKKSSRKIQVSVERINESVVNLYYPFAEISDPKFKKFIDDIAHEVQKGLRERETIPSPIPKNEYSSENAFNDFQDKVDEILRDRAAEKAVALEMELEAERQLPTLKAAQRGLLP